MSENKKIIVVESGSPARIDIYLARHLSNLTRSQIKKLIESSLIEVNGKTVKPNYLVKPQDTITAKLPVLKNEITPQNIPLNIIYEDEDLLIIDKPANLTVHPTQSIKSNTLVNALLHYKIRLADTGDKFRPGIVHRLDKDTSGLIVVVKSEAAYNNLKEQFKNHALNKEYFALVYGVPKSSSGEINFPIGRDIKNRKLMSTTSKKAREAKTSWQLIENFGDVASLLRLKLHTGRTHQIRVHLKKLGYPIIGDATYKFRKAPNQLKNIAGKLGRQALHSCALGFIHPIAKKYIEFKSDLPLDIKEAIVSLRRI